MKNEREQVKAILHDAIHWGCRYEPCPNLNCEQCALDRIDALYEPKILLRNYTKDEMDAIESQEPQDADILGNNLEHFYQGFVCGVSNKRLYRL